MMPTKTIYVADADLPIFERAQQLAGSNLSAAIAQALRRFITIEEAKMSGFQEITVRVGDKSTYTSKRFLGRPLAKRRIRDSQQRVTTLTIFQTAKGKFALYTKTTPDWGDPSAWSAWSSSWSNWTPWNWDMDWDSDPAGSPQPKPPRPPRPPSMPGWLEGGEYRLEVFETLDALREHVPPELYDAAQHALSGPEIEDLDI